MEAAAFGKPQSFDMPAGVVAGVTVFRPERELLLALLDRLSGDGVASLIYVDGPTGPAIEADLLRELHDRPELTIIQGERNAGIGAGLNILASAAAARGFREVLFFDQDSTPERGSAARLVDALHKLQAKGQTPAAIGMRPVNAPGADLKPPRYCERAGLHAVGASRPVDFVITSGSLVPLEAAARVGPFRADYFIDAIDVEWCMRAWSLGYSVWVDEEVQLLHRVGTGVVRFGPLRFPEQSEWRMASYFRNQIYSLRLRHIPLRWKLRMCLYLPVQAAAFVASRPKKRMTAGLLGRAVIDGMRSRLGAPRHGQGVRHDDAG